MTGAEETRPISSPADFHASRGLLPESVEGWTTTAISGLSCIDLFWSRDAVSCWLKMCLTSSAWRVALTGYSLTWKAAATPAGRSLYRLRLSAPTTAAIGSGLWPTTTATDRPNEGSVRLLRAMVESGELDEDEAEAMLGKSVWEAQGKIPELWPTPNSAVAANDTTLQASGDGREKPNKLGWAVAQRLYPTPTSDRPREMSTHLGTQVKMLPTPTGQDGKNTAGPSTFERNSLPLNAVAANGVPGLKLSAAWVGEFLMGYPRGWMDDLPTDPLAPKATTE